MLRGLYAREESRLYGASGRSFDPDAAPPAPAPLKDAAPVPDEGAAPDENAPADDRDELDVQVAAAEETILPAPQAARDLKMNFFCTQYEVRKRKTSTATLISVMERPRMRRSVQSPSVSP